MASDTVSARLLLERMTGARASDGELFPAAAAVGYAGMGVLLLMARWFTEPNAVETRN
jgi:hypothetical protein